MESSSEATRPRRRRGHGPLLVTIALAGLALTTISACTPQIGRKELLAEQENAPYRRRGSATIEGQVRLRLPSGEDLYGAACSVRLAPVTTETTAYLNDVVLPGDTTAPIEKAGDINWVETADDLGRFRFIDLPGGSFYVTCPIAWEQDGKIRKAIAWTRAQVAEGGTVSVVVTREDGSGR